MNATTHRGGCHCGAVTFEVDAPADIEAIECNCSMCSMCGFLHLIVPQEQFRLTGGSESLTTYTFNTETAKHKFCNICGVKPFYIPRSHPDGISVNVNCLDESSIASLSLVPFDGENWEQSSSDLSPISD